MDEDPSRILPKLFLILVLVLLNAFFAAAEMALVSVRRTRIKQLVEEGNERALLVQHLLERPTNFMATVQIGVTMVGFLASAFAAVDIAWLPAKWFVSLGLSEPTAGTAAVVGVTVLLGMLMLVVGEIAPKSLAMQHPEKLALYSAGMLRFISVIAQPAVIVVSFLSNILVRPFGGHVKFSAPILTEEELKMLVEAGEEDGVLEEGEREMIHSIFDFTDTVARQVMVPRTDMDAAPITSSLDDLLDIITNTGHTRIPIYEDNVDKIVGVINAKDLLPVLRQDKQLFDINTVMREPYSIPETKELNELLTEFKRGNVQIAIVRDEYGGTAGLVTVEDLLEEIVGDIKDEYDVEEPLINQIDEDHADVSARMSIDDLNEQMNLDIPESEEFETIGGFIFDLFGCQPNEGESISWSNLDFVVDKIEDGRIQTISVVRTDRPIDVEDDSQNGSGSKTKNGSINGKKKTDN